VTASSRAGRFGVTTVIRFGKATGSENSPLRVAYTRRVVGAIDKVARCENSVALCTKTVDHTMVLVCCSSVGHWGESFRGDFSADTMERTQWTDERIDDRMTAMDEKWDRQFEELRTLRAEMRAGFTELRVEMQSGFSDLRAELATTRADLWSLQKQVLAIVAAAAAGLIGLLGALVAAQF
jgi:hypothetical protein